MLNSIFMLNVGIFNVNYNFRILKLLKISTSFIFIKFHFISYCFYLNYNPPQAAPCFN